MRLSTGAQRCLPLLWLLLLVVSAPVLKAQSVEEAEQTDQAKQVELERRELISERERTSAIAQPREAERREVETEQREVEQREAETIQPREEIEQRPEPIPERERAPAQPIEAEQQEAIAAPKREPEPEPEQEKESESAEPPAITRPPIQRSGSLLGHSSPPPVPVPPPRPTAPATSDADPATQTYEPGELLLVSANMADAQSAARQLQRYQLQVKSRQQLDNLGLVISVFRLPPGTDVPALVAQLQTELPDLNLDTNQRYQLLNARREYGQMMIGWPEPLGTCAGEFRIGMLDTPVADTHPALRDTDLVRRNFVRGESASAVHGTAVASLLIGKPGSLTPGMLPGSKLFAAEVFRQRGDPANAITDTTTDTLLAALDWLASENVQAINLSLGGERNRVFELALAQLLERNIRLVAAAGNQGPEAPPVFPAAQPGVIAVTAVDVAEQVYPDANRGEYIDLAAPGVDVWAADGATAGRYHSGTSFASPFVTAALLLADAKGIDLLETVKDLGSEGRDDQFGWGLVQVGQAGVGCQ